MIDIEKLKLDLVERLKKIDPEKVILFGSYAYGTPTEDSDVDLYVVTKDDFLPESFKAKSNIVLEVSKRIRDLQKQIPIDVIVHTKPMHCKFIEMDSMFSKKILNEGQVLYERHH